MPTPIPGLIELSAYQNQWETYLNALYEIYIQEIVEAGLQYDGIPVKFQFRPITDGKGSGFWHIISQGENENDRTPDLRRCERILWIAWVIRQANNDPGILWFENQRNGNQHVVLWFPAQHYAVILAKRAGYYLLRSAYVLEPHRERSFEKEWKSYWKKS